MLNNFDIDLSLTVRCFVGAAIVFNYASNLSSRSQGTKTVFRLRPDTRKYSLENHQTKMTNSIKQKDVKYKRDEKREYSNI